MIAAPFETRSSANLNIKVGVIRYHFRFYAHCAGKS